MKRIVVLIESPGIPFLNGVEKGIKNMKAFLKSANGGGWTTDEIKELPTPNPSASQTLALLDTINNIDFAFVYFSGHGFTGSDNGSKININPTEVI